MCLRVIFGELPFFFQVISSDFFLSYEGLTLYSYLAWVAGQVLERRIQIPAVFCGMPTIPMKDA